MLPVLFSIGNLSVSSFGVFLVLAFLYGIFLIWRLARAWDLDEEKILDLTLVTFLGGLIGARLYFAIEHLPFFLSSPFRLIIFTKYPGFSFWGGFLGGWITLFYMARRLKQDFWQIVDIGSVGFLGGLIFESLGCFLGGCGVGIQTNLFLAVPMVGTVGKRLPVQLFEVLIFIIILNKIWHKVTHFHQRGKIAGLTFALIGVTKLLMEPLKQFHTESYFFPSILTILGLTIFYKVSRKNPLSDLKAGGNFSVKVLTNSSFRKIIIDGLGKSWYNQKTLVYWRIRNLKKILKRVNVKFSYKTN